MWVVCDMLNLIHNWASVDVVRARDISEVTGTGESYIFEVFEV